MGRRGAVALPDFARMAFLNCRQSAGKRRHAFEMSPHEHYAMTQMDCTYCGAAPAPRTVSRDKQAAYGQLNGIDRIDSSRGYVPGNVQPCCTSCNIAKLDRSDADFRAWLLRAADHIRPNS